MVLNFSFLYFQVEYKSVRQRYASGTLLIQLDHTLW